MRFPSPFKRADLDRGLRTERQIQMFRQREAAMQDRAERREAEARVRWFNFLLAQAVVFLAVTVTLTIAFMTGLAPSPRLLEVAIPAAGASSAIATAFHRRGPGQGD
jgi:hypothetical protein